MELLARSDLTQAAIHLASREPHFFFQPANGTAVLVLHSVACIRIASGANILLQSPTLVSYNSAVPKESCLIQKTRVPEPKPIYRDGHRERKKKPEVKILGDYLLKKMQYVPP